MEREVLKIFRYDTTTSNSNSTTKRNLLPSETLPNTFTKDNIRVDRDGVSRTTYNRTDYQVFSDVRGSYIIIGNTRYYFVDPSASDSFPSIAQEVFTFYINPKNIDIAENKAKTRIKTRRGWEFQFWGNEPTVISVSGVSGGTLWQDSGRTVPATSTQDSYAWKRISDLKNLYFADHNDRNQDNKQLLGLYYGGKVFVGHFDSFTGPTEDSEQPNIFQYSFKFTVEFEATDLGQAGQNIISQTTKYNSTIDQLQQFRSTAVE